MGRGVLWVSAALIFIIALGGCTQSRYKMKHDVAPEGTFDFSDVPDATPIWEPMSPQGNRSPYEVNAKQYEIMASASGYVEDGVSSWYGLKFHGELTSNGETYNMYEMSAAHKTLPLPTYLRVTNLENGKTVVVRVNDRGPFHSNRIIDLSFAAASRLGFADQGTAKVRLEALTPDKKAADNEASSSSISPDIVRLPHQRVSASEDRLAPFVQVAAFSSLEAAKTALENLTRRLGYKNVFVAQSKVESRAIYRVRVGPFESAKGALSVRQKIEQAGIGAPIVITRSVLAQDR